MSNTNSIISQSQLNSCESLDSSVFSLPFTTAATRFNGAKRGRKPSLDNNAELASLFSPSTRGQERSNTGSKFTKTSALRIREKFRLQDESRRLLGASSRVHSCLRARVSDTVSAFYSSKWKRGFCGGLATCGSAYLCPVCALKIAARRQQELKDALAGSVGRELTPIFVTYTLPHKKSDELKKLFDDLRWAHTKSLEGRLYGKLANTYGIIGRIVAVEVVYGDNGWHPHLHVLFLSALKPQFIDLAKFEDDLFSSYSRRLESRGYDPSQKAFKVKLVESNQDGVAEYLLADYSKYGISAEMTQAAAKNSKKGNSLTPFGLLKKSADGCEKSAKLFLEYIRAMKRKSVLRWSRGLRQKLGVMVEHSDEELAKMALEEAVLVDSLTDKEWNFVIVNKLRGQLYIALSSCQGDPVQFELFLVAQGIRKGTIEWS